MKIKFDCGCTVKAAPDGYGGVDATYLEINCDNHKKLYKNKFGVNPKQESNNLVLSKLYNLKVQCPQVNCSSQQIEFIKEEKALEYFKCMVCNFRFAIWEIKGLAIIKK